MEGGKKMTIGESIRAKREAVGMSQTELAQRIATTPATISRMESDTKIPSVALCRSIAKALDCGIADIIPE